MESKCPLNGLSINDSSSDYSESAPSITNGFSFPSLGDSRQFNVLDEISEDRGSGTENDSNDSDSYDSEVPDDEIEAMLEEGLPDEFKGRKRKRDGGKLINFIFSCMYCEKLTSFLSIIEEGHKPYEERDKTVLIEKGQNHFDVLPEGWIQVTHNSGMPLYLHKGTRVCTLAKPYFLGPGSVRVKLSENHCVIKNNSVFFLETSNTFKCSSMFELPKSVDGRKE